MSLSRLSCSRQAMVLTKCAQVVCRRQVSNNAMNSSVRLVMCRPNVLARLCVNPNLASTSYSCFYATDASGTLASVGSVPPRDHHSGVKIYPEPYPADWHHSERPGRVDHGYGHLPGPYFTMDEAPVPHLPFEEERRKMNETFNKTYLLVGIGFAIATLLIQYDSGAFDFELMLTPSAYKNRVIYKGDGGGSGGGGGGGAAKAGVPLVAGTLVSDKSTEAPKPSKKAEPPKDDAAVVPLATPSSTKLPEHVPYLLVGAGSASFAAFRAIRANDANAKVLVIGDEPHNPYMRPPLSKELWFTDDRKVSDTLRFKQWNGKERSIFFEQDAFYLPPDELDGAEHGGVSVVKGSKVIRLDVDEHVAHLDDGRSVKYDKCLLATGGKSKNLKIITDASPEIQEKVTVYRNIDDFRRLDELTRKVHSIAIVGGGFLGSELACALGRRSRDLKLEVTQIFPEKGNMGKVLPEYLSKWSTARVQKEGVTVVSQAELVGVSQEGNQLLLHLSTGETLKSDHIVVAVGIEANVELADTSGLEVDREHGGFRADAELRSRTDIWVAGDCCSFYDVKLGRRRVEHHDHAAVSGRLAGENMTGAGKPYWHQSMFWSDLGPDVGYEAIGVVDANLPTVGVFARQTDRDTPRAEVERSGEAIRSETVEKPNASSDEPGRVINTGDDYGKGVIFYTNGKKVVGIVLWNVFNKMPVARKILKDGKEIDDFAELAKLFNLYGTAFESSGDNV